MGGTKDFGPRRDCGWWPWWFATMALVRPCGLSFPGERLVRIRRDLCEGGQDSPPMILAILGEPHYRAIAQAAIEAAFRPGIRSGVMTLEAGSMDNADKFVVTRRSPSETYEISKVGARVGGLYRSTQRTDRFLLRGVSLIVPHKSSTKKKNQSGPNVSHAVDRSPTQTNRRSTPRNGRKRPPSLACRDNHCYLQL